MIKMIPLMILFLLASCLNEEAKNKTEKTMTKVKSPIDGKWTLCVPQEDDHSRRHTLFFDNGIMSHQQENFFNTDCNKESLRSTRITEYSFKIDKDKINLNLLAEKLMINEKEAVEPANDESYCGKNDWKQNQIVDITTLQCDGNTIEVGKSDVAPFSLSKDGKSLVVGSKTYKKL